jgi:2-keto-3-deoxy-galactonokinase
MTGLRGGRRSMDVRMSEDRHAAVVTAVIDKGTVEARATLMDGDGDGIFLVLEHLEQ